ncbi:MAG: Crp/Fnr family transcriptional regulator [Oceanihabitans sp.]
MKEGLLENYNNILEAELLQEINSFGKYKKVKAGTLLIDIGQEVTQMPLLLSGAIKIMQEDENEEELILYYLEQGDTCAITLSCCLGLKKSKIRAVAETDTTLIMLPIALMSQWMKKYISWQNFVLESYNERLNEMLEAINTLAFYKLDERLFKYLRDKAMVNKNEIIQVTHQEIANDLHTSRVVVSRLLKALEREKKILLKRNQIQVLAL